MIKNMYTVNTEKNPVGKNSVGCLSKGSCRLLIWDRVALHTGRWLPRYQKALDYVWEEYLYNSVRAFPLWKCLFVLLIPSFWGASRTFYCLQYMCPSWTSTLWDRRVHNCPCLWLKTSLFLGDNIGKGPSYNYFIFPVGRVSASSYTSVR
jgi:hypothetical protein